MATDLKKMVGKPFRALNNYLDKLVENRPLYKLLKVMAAEIEGNREEIEMLKQPEVNPYLLDEKEIEKMRKRMNQ